MHENLATALYAAPLLGLAIPGEYIYFHRFTSPRNPGTLRQPSQAAINSSPIDLITGLTAHVQAKDEHQGIWGYGPSQQRKLCKVH